MQNARKSVEVYLQSDGKWIATVWFVREFYNAEGENEQDAVANLMEHLRNIIPIYENDILVAQERIREIKQFVSKPPVQDLVLRQ